MCLILFAYHHHPKYRLVLAANRDEFLDRPTAPLGYNYVEEPILSGKDLRAGGTWLGLSSDGRLAAITNYRDPVELKPSAPSRGEIILQYLRSGLSPQPFLAEFTPSSGRFCGFNLLLLDRREFCHFSNISGVITPITPGIHGLSNHLLDTPWPKIHRGKLLFEDVLDNEDDVQLGDDLLTLLTDRVAAPDDSLPDTGVGEEWERVLSPVFIESPEYGTRSSTVVLYKYDGSVVVSERDYLHPVDGHVTDTEKKTFILSS